MIGTDETPQAQWRRGGSRTARGKRVPGVEINGQILKAKKEWNKLYLFHSFFCAPGMDAIYRVRAPKTIENNSIKLRNYSSLIWIFPLILRIFKMKVEYTITHSK
ncbi:hypothetical protein AKG34_03690 [Peribacillus butanolivorans]|nr:hypothetical protein AKG34_03690 [Peribacillus butanolivorans]